MKVIVAIGVAAFVLFAIYIFGLDTAAAEKVFPSANRNLFPLLTGVLTVLAILYSATLSADALKISNKLASDNEALQRQLAQQNETLQRTLNGQNLAQQKAALETNTLIVCNERYDKIWELIWQLQHRKDAPPTDAEVHMVYRRYWGLQHDQFQYFKDQVISEDKFSYWLRARHSDYHRIPPVKIGDVTFAQGWQHVRYNSDIKDKVFFDVLEAAMDMAGSKNPVEDCVKAAIGVYRNSLKTTGKALA